MPGIFETELFPGLDLGQAATAFGAAITSFLPPQLRIIVGGLVSIGMAGEANRLQQEYDRMTEEQKADVLASFDEAERLGLEGFDKLRAILPKFASLSQDIVGQIGTLGEQQVEGFRGREQLLEGAGLQERRDIERRFDAQQGGLRGHLAARGLSGTTLQPSLGAGIERSRSDAIGGLEERLRGQRLDARADTLGVQSDFGMAAINAQSELGFAELDLERAITTAQTGFETGLELNRARFFEDQLIMPPNTQGLQQNAFGQGFNTVPG